MTSDEQTAMEEAGSKYIPGHTAAFTWIIARVKHARKQGHLEVDHADMLSFLDQLTVLRSRTAKLAGKRLYVDVRKNKLQLNFFFNDERHV